MKKHLKFISCIMLLACMITLFAGCKKYSVEDADPMFNLSGETAEISGVWELNENPDLHEFNYEEFDAEKRGAQVKFTCSGKKYQKIYWYYSADSEDRVVLGLYYTEDKAFDPWSYCAYMEGHVTTDSIQEGWQNEKYKIIDFGTEPQTVNKEFYDWFVANATPVP